MASVQYGRLAGPAGFARAVAIKKLHAQFARDADFVSMFLDEARLAAHIAHANVIPTIDVLSEEGEVAVVMEYVHGESLSGLLSLCAAQGGQVPFRIATNLLVGVLHGLHAAHETRGEGGEPLNIVHRDVSPQNILVGSDGVARVLDFGIAKAEGKRRMTPTGELKGKLAYMACEQYRGEVVDRRVDVYGASVVLWETLTGRCLFDGPNDAAVANAVLNYVVPKPSELVPGLPEALDQIVARGISRDRSERFATARDMALALERDVGLATQSDVIDWIQSVAGDMLARRADALRRMQRHAEASATEVATGGTRRLEVGSGTRAVARESRGTPSEGIAGAAALSRDMDQRRFWSTWKWAVLALCLMGLGLVSAYAWSRQQRAQLPTAPVTDRQQPTLTPSITAPQPLMAPSPVRVFHGATPPADSEQATAVGEAVPAAQPGGAQEPDDHKPERKRPSGRTKSTDKGESRKPGRAEDESKSADCREPTVLDSDGIRRIKRECL